MLTVLCGTAANEKLQYMIQVAEQAALAQKDSVKQNILWLVPDQFTFETERSLMQRLSPFARSKMIVTGFMRFSGMLMKQYGGVAGRYADQLCKTVLMRKALSDCKDLLHVYQKQLANGDLQFEAQLLQFVRQLKFSGITPEDLQKAGEDPTLSEGLKQKTKDLAAIAMQYEARLSASYRDSLDDLSAANEKLYAAMQSGDAYFRGKTVVLDGFKSFTAPQYDMIRLMLRQGAALYVSLQLDLKEALQDRHSIYALTLDTYDRLLALTGGNCQKPDFAPLPPKNALQAVRQGLFLSDIPTFEKDDSVQYFSCRDEYAEAEHCFAAIKSMLKDDASLRLRDIAVVYREEGEYLFPILCAAQKYELPYAVDGGMHSDAEPLFLVCLSLLRAAYRQFTSTDMLCIVKSGLFPCEDIEAAQLEEYLYVWRAESFSDWSRPFTAKLSGYGNDDFEALPLGDGPERLRQKLMAAIESLKAAQSGTGKQYGSLLYDVLSQLGILHSFALQLQQTEQLQEKQQLDHVWNTFCALLTRISDALAEDTVSGEEYTALFAQSVKETKIKTVGQTIDCILVGNAQTIRLQNPKVLWILGANDGVFPKSVSSGGSLFTDMECKQFQKLDFTVGKTVEESAFEERFIAYQMLQAPRERLFVTYRNVDLGGGDRMEGELIWRLEAMFGQKAPKASLTQREMTTSEQTVLDAYCSLVREHPKEASLYLDLLHRIKNGRYDALLDTVSDLISPKRFVLTSPDTVQSLYALYERMISPSEIEQYFACPFAYFVKYGLKLKVKERAAYNPLLRGNVLHHVVASLSKPISALAKQHADQAAENGDLPQAAMIKAMLSKLVGEAFDAEMDKLFENPGRISAKDKALVQSMKLRILRICENIYAEQLQSKFEVFAVEFDVGRSPILPLRIPIESGKSVRIRGRIDRLDTYQQAGQTYFRIIDYKTGEKKFEYAKLLSGEHLQMLLYEMAVASGGQGGFAGMIPAGVLYYPAKEIAYLKDRNVTDQQRKTHIDSSFCMDGVLIDDEALECVRAMEKELKQYYIPVGYNKKNEMDTQALCSPEEYKKIEQYAKSRVRKMAREVLAGVIEPAYKKDKNVCKYCQYSALCGNDIRTEALAGEPLSEADAMQIILSQEESTWN